MSANQQNWRNLLTQCLLLNLAATIVSFAFNLTRFGFGNFTWRELLASFVYSNSIGTATWFVIFRLSTRWNHNSFILRLLKVSISLTFATFIGVIIARSIFAVIYPELTKYGIFPSWRNFLFSLSMTFTFGFGVYFYELSQTKLRQKAIDEEKAKTLATEAQLASLESRIHPHFLFNTLNSIAALIREDPILAEKTVEKLSALLRYSLDSNAKSLVTLEQELEITKKYLEIEKIRFEKRLAYKIECSPQFLGTKLPPLSLQTLVENSIKHIASKTSEKTEIEILVKENGSILLIEVHDNGKGFSAKNLKENHGLDNLQKRLQTIFGESGNLQFAENDQGYIALILPKT